MILDKSLIGADVCITWRREDDDWPYFLVLKVRPKKGLLKLRGMAYPDGSAQHDGDEFWCSAREIRGMERVVPGGFIAVITVPIRTGLGLNSREHWGAKAKRVKAERSAVSWAICQARKPDRPCVVTLTRCGPSNGMDDDGLAGSLKGVRDEIAAWLGVDDRRREIVRYEYKQRRAKFWSVEIGFAPMQVEQVPALLAGEPGSVTT